MALPVSKLAAAGGNIAIALPGGGGGGGPPATLLSSTQSPDSGADLGMNMADTALETLDFANNFTIAMWAKSTTLANSQWLTVAAPGAGNADRIELRTQSMGGITHEVWLYDSAGALFKRYTWTSQPTVNVWYHIALTWDGTNLIQYWNGAIDPAGMKTVDNSGTMTDTARGLWQAVFSTGATGWYLGRFYQSGYWKSVLTSAEIADLAANATADYRANFGNYASAADLQHYYVYGEDMTNIGTALQDYGAGSNKKDLDTNAQFLTFPTDWVTDTPP